MICPICEKELQDGTEFCPYCGNLMKTGDSISPKPSEDTAKSGKKKSPIPWIAAGGVLALLLLLALGILFFRNVGHGYDRLISAAAKYAEDEDYERAVEAYGEAIRLDPENPDAYKALAELYLAMGDADAAENVLEKGVKKTDSRSLDTMLADLQEQGDNEKKNNANSAVKVPAQNASNGMASVPAGGTAAPASPDMEEGVSENPESAVSVTEAEFSAPERQETVDTGIEVAMDAKQQYEANIFISNFTEVYFENFNREQAGAKQILDFAMLHARINSADSLRTSSDGSCYVLSLEEINKTTSRYLGLSVTDSLADQYPDNATSYYTSQTFYYARTDGSELGNSFAVVDRKTDQGDGTYMLYFHEYRLDLDKLGLNGGNNVSKEQYEMTPGQAMNSSYLIGIGEGEALVEPYLYNERNTYHLISFRTY